MRLRAPLLAVAGTTLGVVAAVIAYQAGAGGSTVTATPKRHSIVAVRPAPPPKPRTVFMRCEKGTRLRHGVCVRVVRKVVVVTDPAAATGSRAVAQSGPSPARRHAGASGRSRDDGGNRHKARSTDGRDDGRAGDDSGHEPEHHSEQADQHSSDPGDAPSADGQPDED